MELELCTSLFFHVRSPQSLLLGAVQRPTATCVPCPPPSFSLASSTGLDIGLGKLLWMAPVSCLWSSRSQPGRVGGSRSGNSLTFQGDNQAWP